MKKIGLFFWGMSNEHDVSIISAKNIVKYIDQNLYTLELIYRSPQWKFYHLDTIEEVTNILEKQNISIDIFPTLFEKALLMTHGKYGEDWVLQWILESQKLPYCWCRVLSSALCMDKWIFKTFLAWAGIPQTPFISLDTQVISSQELQHIFSEAKTKFTLPIYIKPCNSWSSVGITRVDDFDLLATAIQTATKHDTKILIEQWLITPKEVEIAILGNKELVVSEPGELILQKDFYDYDDKYKNNTTIVQIPAHITQEQTKNIQEIAAQVYQLCDCRGFSRIDFFVTEDWNIYLNEINTLPWFTDISMFPMLMNYMGISFSELISRIIELGY